MQSGGACAENVHPNPAAFREKSQAFHALAMRARRAHASIWAEG